MRFHWSGELSLQKRPISVCSGVRLLGVVMPSPPSSLISLKSEANFLLRHVVGRPRTELRAVAQHEGRDVAPSRGEDEVEARGEAVLTRLSTLLIVEVLQRRVGTIPLAQRKNGRCGCLPERDGQRLGRTGGNCGERGRVVRLDAGDASLKALRRERNLLDDRDHHVAGG